VEFDHCWWHSFTLGKSFVGHHSGQRELATASSERQSTAERDHEDQRLIVSDQGSSSVVLSLQGTEVWSISMASSELVECILRNKREIHPVTVNIKGYYDVKTDLFLSIPAIVGRNGVSHLITSNFNHSSNNEHRFSTIINSINTIIKERLSHI
jgi:malate/lactate dehydrogenase